MAEHRLKPLCPLGASAPQTATVGPVTLTEVTDVAMASLSSRMGREAEVAQAAEAAGIALAAPGRWADRPPFASFWLSADSWMIEAPFASHEDIRAALVPLFGTAASITEQTDAWVAYDLAAADLAPLMERLCNPDFVTAPDGFATRTVIEHLGCYLIRQGSGAVRIYGPRSSAQSLLHALEAAAAAVW